MSSECILIVEDDVAMLRLLSSHLEAHGYTVVSATTGKEALRAVEQATVDVVLLDLGLPDVDGLEVCRGIRARSSAPIIMVTATHDPEVKVQSLDIGGDDYLTKPFHAGELVARIRAALRRSRPEPAPTVMELGDLVIDIPQRRVTVHGNEVPLTKIEFELMRELVGSPDRVLTYKYLLEKIWGPGYDDIRPVHVHISHLRRKLESGGQGRRRIVPVPGIGYRFRAAE